MKRIGNRYGSFRPACGVRSESRTYRPHGGSPPAREAGGISTAGRRIPRVRISIPARKPLRCGFLEPVGNPAAPAVNPPPIGPPYPGTAVPGWLLVAVAVLAGCGIVAWILHLGGQAAGSGPQYRHKFSWQRGLPDPFSGRQTGGVHMAARGRRGVPCLYGQRGRKPAEANHRHASGRYLSSLVSGWRPACVRAAGQGNHNR